MAARTVADEKVMTSTSEKESKAAPKRRVGPIATLGAGMALIAILEALVLIFHIHHCPPGWTAFDFDAPVGVASLIITVPLLAITISSALVGFGKGKGVVRRLAFSSVVLVVAATAVALALALVLGWGAASNLSSSTNGCLTF